MLDVYKLHLELKYFIYDQLTLERTLGRHLTRQSIESKVTAPNGTSQFLTHNILDSYRSLGKTNFVNVLYTLHNNEL